MRCAPRNWCPWRESDPRPLPYQGSALPLSHKGETPDKLTGKLERETGIEPVSLAWKAKVLPLNYSRPGSLGPLPTSHAERKLWWRRLDSNQRTQCGQIYSLLPLTTRPPLLRQARNYSTGSLWRNRPGREKLGRPTARATVRRQHPDGHALRRAGHARGEPQHPKQRIDCRPAKRSANPPSTPQLVAAEQHRPALASCQFNTS